MSPDTAVSCGSDGGVPAGGGGRPGGDDGGPGAGEAGPGGGGGGPGGGDGGGGAGGAGACPGGADLALLGTVGERSSSKFGCRREPDTRFFLGNNFAKFGSAAKM